MKRIIYIAKNELFSLFYSPVAWLLMMLLLILTSIDYMDVMGAYLIGYQKGKAIHEVTHIITSHRQFGYFGKIIHNLYLFLPFITMGLISREIDSGTIKLLYSSPLKVSEIVLGKFLSMIVFSGVMLVLVGCTMIAMFCSVNNPDYWPSVVFLGGLLLITCAYAAIGIFISSLTSYQIAAAIITFAILGALSKIGGYFQEYHLVRDITYYLTIDRHAIGFINGVTNIRDISYFLIIITSFLLFTMIRIKSAAESISRLRKISRYAIVIVGALIVGFLTSIPGFNRYYDVTRDKLNTIAVPTQSSLARLNEGELKVTVYVNLFSPSYWMFAPFMQNSLVEEIWGPYRRFKHDIKVDYVYYYYNIYGENMFKWHPGKTLEQIAYDEAKTWKISLKNFLKPEEVNKLFDVNAEDGRNFFSLKYKNKTAVLRTFDDSDVYPYEDQIAAALNRLSTQPPKILLLSGHIERGIYSKRERDYTSLIKSLPDRTSMINRGYDADTINLRYNDIPDDISVLAIADPRTAIDNASMQKINKYIASGGNLLLCTEPDRKDYVKPIFNSLGLRLREGRLLQPTDRFESDVVFPYLSDTAQNLLPELPSLFKDYKKEYGDSLYRLGIMGANVIEYGQAKEKGFAVQPIAITDSTLAWNRIAAVSEDSLQLKVKRLPSDEHGRFTTAILMSRKINGKEQRIIVSSDADFLSRKQVYGNFPRYFNSNFSSAVFSYFSYGNFPANTMHPEDIDNGYKIKVKDRVVQRTILYFIIPGLIGIIGIILLIKRRRK